MPRTIRPVLLLLLGAAGCASQTKTSTGRTERETDSVIGQSQVPGAPVVQKALDASDSARARVAREDSVATAQ
jgi:hypothetical protein